MSILDQIMQTCRTPVRSWGGGGTQLLGKKWTLYSKFIKQLSLLLTRILFTLVCLPYWHQLKRIRPSVPFSELKMLTDSLCLYASQFKNWCFGPVVLSVCLAVTMFWLVNVKEEEMKTRHWFIYLSKCSVWRTMTGKYFHLPYNDVRVSPTCMRKT